MREGKVGKGSIFYTNDVKIKKNGHETEWRRGKQKQQKEDKE